MRGGQQDLPAVLVTMLLIAIILAVGTFTISQVAAIDSSFGGGQTTTETVDTAAELEGTNAVQLGDATGTNETVRNSKGNALAFSAANDSNLNSAANINISNDTSWTVTQPVLAINNTSREHILLAIGDPTLLLLYDPTAGWSAVYYTDSNSYRVNVSAPSPGTTTFITARHNGTAIEILRNTTTGESVDTASANAISGDYTSGSCACTLDETRAWGETLTDTEISNFIAEPVRPVQVQNRTLRVMYDRRGDVPLYFAGGSATRSNASTVGGFEGETMDEKAGPLDVNGSNDYQWDRAGPVIKPVDGARLDGAPVAFVEYERTTEGTSLAASWEQAVLLAGVLLLLLPAGVIVVALRAANRR